MIIPKLRKERTVKIYHGHKLTDDYAFVDQANILQILKKPDLILPEVRKYIESNNELTEAYFADVKDFQKKLFSEIKGKIKLSDEGLKYKERNYFYWSWRLVKRGGRHCSTFSSSSPCSLFSTLIDR